MDDVVADLAARRYQYEPIDIGYRVEPGFAIFSMGSRWARDLDPDASEDDPRSICEGVSVAPYRYVAGPTDEEIEAYIRSRETPVSTTPEERVPTSRILSALMAALSVNLWRTNVPIPRFLRAHESRLQFGESAVGILGLW
ncbi:MAG: hypothetical protein J2P17_32580 [Mycobacterium sp.]|nr:hypothetical protein [Mycobacterium sp.]